ncbi:MAG: hypothetical protein GY857_11480, partial [Desulfobacula sp.]|nr:hypothetical protein [Desulfobacula sp.]
MKDKLKIWLKSFADKNNPDEFDAKNLVSIYSIKTPHGQRFGSKDKFNLDTLDIGKSDIKNKNCAYVLKVCSSKILHKTELNGV